MNDAINQAVDNCIFCRKEFTEKPFCKATRFSAYYNIAPILPGHSLIIPNKHYESLTELSDNELSEMMLLARKITSVLKTVFSCDGFDWTIQDGVSAGQTVPHLHLHIIPRKPLDMPESNEWYSKIHENEMLMLDSQKRERIDENSYNSITAKLSEACKVTLG